VFVSFPAGAVFKTDSEESWQIKLTIYRPKTVEFKITDEQMDTRSKPIFSTLLVTAPGSL